MPQVHDRTTQTKRTHALGSRFKACLTLVPLLFFLAADSATAKEITFFWNGSVSFVDPAYAGVLTPLGIVVSAPMSGSYTFESTTADTEPGDANLGEYAGAITAWTTSIGSLTFSLDGAGPVNEISVVLDPAEHFYNPAASIEESPPAAGLPAQLTGDIFLLDLAKTAITSDALPLIPPNVDDFTAALIGIFNEQTALVVIDANMSQLWEHQVPMLSTPALLVLVTLMLSVGTRLRSAASRGK
jgi:hypothetical protein